MLKTLAALLVGTLMAGCAFHQKQPWPAFSEAHPNADTAIFVSLDQSSPYVDARIAKVDSSEPPSWINGYPFWARVKPGNHRFDLVLKSNFALGPSEVTWLEGKRSVTLTDMKAKHVYVARYVREGAAARIQIVDLGENPDFHLTFGLNGVNDNRYRAEF
jgi:hypothetical protein